MTEQKKNKKSLAAVGSLGFIRVYQKVLSPILGGSCRYHPSCSHYTYEAIEIHGAAKGTWLGVKRIGRCQPFFKGGFDPVPGSPDDFARQESQGSTS
jgi:putative membrane protein insertion efficiency factor